MKKYIYTVMLFAFTIMANSQELKLSPYSQYLVENTFVISPAYAGIDDVHKLRLSGVAQWLGVENAPLTQQLSYDTRISENTGVGVILYNDRNGNTKQMGAQLSYAYHLILSEADDEYLSFGLSYKFNHFKIDTDKFDDGTGTGNNDPHVGASESTSNHNFEVGALYRIKNYFVGANASNILNKATKIFDNSEPVKLRNYYLFTGYTFLSDNDEYEYEPSLFFKYFEGDGRSVSDINFKARKLTDDGYYWAGINTRFLNDQGFKPLSVSPLLGLKKDKMYLGLGYQFNINESIQFGSYGTPLLVLGYDFDGGRYNTSWSSRK
ncbi:type IX secretion system membrane protein PorP/SprF [Aureibaculum algae]|uniref:Type IX secretion system membrane protein PorP/SprF n=1 Tax=Aureibaculum algae TaxID=2584122 RepID=A0A5B7TVE7_9FLAO|nr:type IX secretion system membrane protein PorP/SprF [Aureibaculum algae]QCX39271.1 type IX secretion system membrane protein PorP/SprF [Aureibaculum algae]